MRLTLALVLLAFAAPGARAASLDSHDQLEAVREGARPVSGEAAVVRAVRSGGSLSAAATAGGPEHEPHLQHRQLRDGAPTRSGDFFG